jgi:hypothetical protein
MSRYSHFGLILFLILIACVTPTPRSPHVGGDPQRKLVLDAYGNLPLSFEPNRGQAATDVRFISRGSGITALFKDAEAVITTPETSVKNRAHLSSPLRLVFLGANTGSHPAAMEIQGGTSNYLVGKVAKRWHTSIPNFGRIHYPDLYPGIDLFFYGNHRKLEHDFVLAPGSDYRAIRVRVEGANGLSVNKDDSLHVAMPAGDLTFDPPQIYQYNANKKIFVAGHYVLAASNEFEFEVGSYNHHLPLVIDPILAYSTYLAGSNTDNATSIAVDSAGNAYITGFTYSSDFPTHNPEQVNCSNACGGADVFVTKLNPAGSALIYSTFVGGSNYDQAAAVAVDSLGNAVVSGSTSSFDFPQKNGMTAVLSSNTNHGFAFSLTRAGSAFNFSTYLGGETADAATGIAVDASGGVYVSGYTESINFPVTNQIGPPPGYFSSDIFLTKLGRYGRMLFSTLIGGTSAGSSGTFGYTPPSPISVAVDSQGEALLAGAAWDGFPTTPGSYQMNYLGSSSQTTNGFLGLLNSGGSAFLYATYLGGSGGAGGDGVSKVAIDALGNVYVTGTTGSLDFPTTSGAFQMANLQAGPISFVTKMDATLSNLIYSTYLGSTQSGYGNGVHATGIAVDGSGNAYIIGNTNEPGFPLVEPLISTLPQGLYGTNATAFLSVLNSSGSALNFSSFFTGSVGTIGTSVAVDSSGNPYITGTTFDSDLPTTSGAFQPGISLPPYPLQHAFVSRLSSLGTPSAAACFSSSTLYFGAIEPGQSYLQPLTLTNCGLASLTIAKVAVSNPIFSITRNGCTTLAPAATCAINVRYSPVVADGSDNATLQIFDNAPISPQTVQLSGYSALPSILIYSSGFVAPDEIIGLTSAPVLTQVQTYGAVPLHITAVTATGDFTAVNLCPKALQPGGYCNLGITFTPTAAGTRTGTLSVYDDATGSPQTFSITGNGLSTYPKPTVSFVSPGSAQAGSGPVNLLIEGSDFFPTTKVTVNGHAVTSKAGPYPEELTVTLSALLLSKVGDLSIQVVNPAPGGPSTPVHFAVYGQVTLGAADVIYEPFTQKFYASIPASSPTNPNSLVTIDPITRLVGPAIPIGNNPGALGLSSDGMTLYVALNGVGSIVPFNLLTQTAGPEIPLGSDPQKGALSASNIQVQPGNPNNFVATLNAGYNGVDGIDLIQNGKVVSQFLNEPPTNTAVNGTRFVNANNVYGWDLNYGSMGLLHFVISGKSLLEAPGISGLFGIGAFDTNGVNLYDVNGQVFNAATGALVGTVAQINNYSPASAVLTDTNSGRSFFLDQYNGILAIDSRMLAEVGTIGSLNATNPPNRLQHWGADGLSYLSYNYTTSGYDLVLLRSGLFYPAVGPNPLPAVASISPSPLASKGANFLLTVNGSHFVRGAVVQWNGSNRTTKWLSPLKLAADIPASDIAVPGTAHISVLNPSPGGGKSVIVPVTIQ